MVLAPKEVRELNMEERAKRLKEIRQELMHEMGIKAMGGAPSNPGKIRELRRAVARVLTINLEDERKKKEDRTDR